MPSPPLYCSFIHTMKPHCNNNKIKIYSVFNLYCGTYLQTPSCLTPTFVRFNSLRLHHQSRPGFNRVHWDGINLLRPSSHTVSAGAPPQSLHGFNRVQKCNFNHFWPALEKGLPVERFLSLSLQFNAPKGFQPPFSLFRIWFLKLCLILVLFESMINF